MTYIFRDNIFDHNRFSSIIYNIYYQNEYDTLMDHLQFLSYNDLTELLANFFVINKIEILKGGKRKSNIFPKLFARNVAFNCDLKV